MIYEYLVAKTSLIRSKVAVLDSWSGALRYGTTHISVHLQVDLKCNPKLN